MYNASALNTLRTGPVVLRQSGKFRPLTRNLRQTTSTELKKGGSDMYSEEYKRAKKEFINCMVFGIVGLGVPFYIGVKEWLPIMKREKEKALSADQKTSI
jgi:hypothetical protein